MSKILFSADWHIKLGQKNVPREWQRNRYRLMYEELEDLAKKYKVVAHIIGGDIFDSMPSLEELELFIEFVCSTNITTFIFDGNHEATKKGQTFFSRLKLLTENISSNVYIIEGISELMGMDVIPYTDLKTFNPKNFKRDILLTHVRGNITPHVKAEIDLEKLSRWKLVFAGDLHSHTNSQKNIIYPGSPVTTSFHRNVTKTGAIIFDNETLEWDWHQLELPQLIRKTVTSEEEMVETKYHHTIYEIVGDVVELSKVQKANPLLDKKVVERVSKSTIDFSNVKTVQAELLLFLTKVKGLKSTDKIMKTFNDHIQTSEME